MFTSTAGTFQNINVTNDFFYTYGGGLRLEYVLSKYVALYLDQLFVQNADQTSFGPNGISQINASNNQWTTTLGAKINPWEKLQIGANMFYTNYTNYSQSSINILDNPNSGAGAAASVPTTAFGFQVSAGFTFE